MTIRESYKLKAGIYLVHWKSGGTSLAAIGIGRAGDRWLAPCNWVAPVAGDATKWRDIRFVQPVLASWERADKIDATIDEAAA